MKQKRKRPIPILIQQAGLQQRWQRGELLVEEAAEPDHPNRKTMRLRRKCAYEEMYGRGMISAEQRNCAERYALLCEKAAGATQDLYAKVSLLSESRNQWEPTAAQHEAYEKLFVIWEGLGRHHTKILNMIVLGNFNIPKIAGIFKVNQHVTNGYVKSTFVRLEEIIEHHKENT